MKKIKLEVIQIQYSQTQTGAYALVLEDRKGKRRIPIIIGGLEAQAIAVELEKMKPTRPLTHDLFKPISSEFGINFTEIIIYNLVEGIFYSKIICSNGEKEIEIDSRTSDAIAIGLRFNCPIYTFDFILSSAGIALEGDTSSSDIFGEISDEEVENESTVNEFSRYSDEQLDELLEKSLDEEEYEKASRIRDEMKNRGKL
jgi:bifunctional DNase/RNase